MQATPFTKEACLDALRAWATKEAPDQPLSPAVLRRDLECLLRLYTVGPQSEPLRPEHTALASPFRRLQLLRSQPTPARIAGGESAGQQAHPRYQFCPPSSTQIPPLVILALMLQHNAHASHVSLTHVLYRQQQPGRTCGLQRETLVEAFQWLGTHTPAWAPRPMTVEGQPCFSLPAVTAEQVLLHYYTQP